MPDCHVRCECGPRFAGRAICRSMAALLLLGGCGLGGGVGPDLGGYTLPDNAALADAPWPRLVDVPDAPPPGVYTAEIPDPATGGLIVAELSGDAARMRARAEALSPPVLTPAERARLSR